MPTSSEVTLFVTRLHRCDVVNARTREVLLDGEAASAGDQQRVARSQLAPAQPLGESGQAARVESDVLRRRDRPVAGACCGRMQRLVGRVSASGEPQAAASRPASSAPTPSARFIVFGF
jgi:hypothetical protein